jgi:hypothetical protein
LLEEVRVFMKVARALFIWTAISADSAAMRAGAERIGTGRTGSEGTEIEPIQIERTGTGERTGIEGIWSDGIWRDATWSDATWAIGTSLPASATIVEGLRASTANGTSKVTPAESLNLWECGSWHLLSVAKLRSSLLRSLRVIRLLCLILVRWL